MIWKNKNENIYPLLIFFRVDTVILDDVFSLDLSVEEEV